MKKYLASNRISVTEILSKYQNIIFDLDDTLYDEKKYLFLAYEKISNEISKMKGINKKEIFSYLVNEFKDKGRIGLFDKMIIKFNLDNNFLDIALYILRNQDLPFKISLYEKMSNFIIAAHKRNKFLSIVTNGNKIQQLNKIKHIDWPISITDFKIIFSADFEPKPSDKAILYILNNYNLERRYTILIGDSSIDKKCAIQSRIDYINVVAITPN